MLTQLQGLHAVCLLYETHYKLGGCQEGTGALAVRGARDMLQRETGTRPMVQGH
ncbi:Hypothetical predicted protein [Pelobates cultripes]|uniref:Uncharacterized protein n=1 Tax=Pelobates cultripes TaxID=61616 RepID=A0AAD1TPG3_PELCU|nr:Hypothetical predicted protein [Pelobates cultripes]